MAYSFEKIVSIIIIFMFVCLPMGWMLVANEPPGAYYPTSNEKIDAFLQATGLSICEKSATQWNVIGALGGTSVLISKDCQVTELDSRAYIHLQKFDTQEHRDSAVNYIKASINRLNMNGAVFTYGAYVILVQGPTGGKPNFETISQVKEALTE
ncbi:hypothetical protein ACKUB1_11585 [Methanospirillum stamsii]|uniref:Uncharacterized protein n=1 Tax=Methanospirillum stamsii TaxID=1277351 RepID=A0A2V2MZZ0_9EURY|nr:hypothetical protein [Methanospirillum stamsii]PWR71910.1 hypothetical protein DLD82_12900 [Methanospirillum stamsii]